MPITWTTEQVLALSPDASSTKNGKSLANLSKWQTLGCTDHAIWGECKGSGKKPYRTQIDLTEPAFRCSCPSRKFPCKHALALFLLLAGQVDSFTDHSPPDWVQEWLEKRSQTAQKKQAKQATADPAAQAKRAEKREAKIQAGLVELDLWLRDLIRQGLATAQTQPYSFWDQPAARMVDAQAPALARRLREMASLTHGGMDWPGRLLAELGQLHLLIQGYQRQETLSEAVVEELRSQLGWTQKQEELLTTAKQPSSAIETLHDTWSVLGLRTFEEDNLRVQRVWLQGSKGRSALILSFAYGSNPSDVSLIPGTALEADLVFYPGLYPLRALVQDRGDAKSFTAVYGITIADAMTAYGSAMAQNPWLSEFPLLLNDVVPCLQDSELYLRDLDGHQLSVNPSFTKQWELLALGGGHPVTLMGEWDGQTLFPLSVWVEDRFMALGVL
ncbi:MAG: SWIM zinc finger family protein [Cyanobacteria bacterium P01_A01_bin.17]